MEELKKECFKCGLTLPTTMYYKHGGMSDGHLNKCKECTKKDTKKREESLKSDPLWVESEKKRCRDRYYRLDYKGKYKQTPDKKKESQRRYLQKYPEKGLSHKYTEIFLTKREGFNLHHWSYNQEDWLDVIELTIKDHGFFHRYIIYDQERMMYRKLDNTLLDTKEGHLKYFEECKIKYEY